MRTSFVNALERAGEMQQLSREDLVILISADEEESRALFTLANSIRAQHLGEEIHLRGLIEFSNYCSQNCLYCGLRRDNGQLPRYRMKGEEIISCAQKAASLGCRTIVLQSGEDRYYTGEMLAEIIATIKNQLDVAVTLSIGEKTREEYALFKEAGADRYLLKHETCDAGLFASLRPGTALEARLVKLKWLGELGYQVGSGMMVGLPGQSAETVADDLLLLQGLQVNMAGIGPFIPNQETPLGSCNVGALDLTLKTVATARLMLPYAHMPATTATGTISPSGRLKALKSGANVLMPNMTPQKYRSSYRLYPGKSGQKEIPEESYGKAVDTVRKVGRKLATGYGHARCADS